MIVYRVRGLWFLHGIAQIAVVLVMFWVWASFVFGFVLQEGYASRHYLIYSVVITVGMIFDLTRRKPSNWDLLHLDVIRNNSRSMRQTVIVFGMLLTYLVATKDLTISRTFLFSFAPFVYLVFFLSNKIMPHFLASFVFSGQNQVKTVLLGSPRKAARLRSWLNRKASYGLRVVGLITDEEGTDDTNNWLPILGRIEETEKILKDLGPTQVVALDLMLAPGKVMGLGEICDRLGIRFFVVNNLEEKVHRAVTLFDDDGLNFVGFRHEPLECPMGRIVKRSLDILISLPVVIGVLPAMSLLVWLLQRSQAPGPVFFRQTRTGKHGTEFEIFKYRTMFVDSGDEARQASVDDPRIFPAGRWMRKLSIDELPQFLNVLRGEMSIVGPRPHLVAHDILFGQIANYYRVRSLIKPGITGLAQVSGLRGEARKEKDLADRIRSDLYYLENWSPILDWMIIFKTARQVLRPPSSAY